MHCKKFVHHCFSIIDNLIAVQGYISVISSYPLVSESVETAVFTGKMNL